MIRFKSVLLAGLLPLAVSAVAAAEPPRILLAQTQAQPGVAPAPAAATDEDAKERDRKRGERRDRRPGARTDAPASPPAVATTPPGIPPAAQAAPAPDAAPAANAAPQAPPTQRFDRGRGPTPPQPTQAQTTAPATPTPPPAAPPPPAAASAAPVPPPGAPAVMRRSGETPLAAPAAVPTPVPPAAATPPAVAASPAPPPSSDRSRRPGEMARPVTPAASTPAVTAAPAAVAAAPVPATDANARRMDDIRGSRRQSQENGRTVIRESGRTIIREGGRNTIRYDETERMRSNARDVSVQQRGRETVTTVVRPDGSRVVTVVDDNQRLMRRSRVDGGGREVVIIDNTRRPMAAGERPFVRLAPPRHRIPRDRYIVAAAMVAAPIIIETLQAPPVEHIERPYALDEIRNSVSVRDRMRRIDVDTITFETGSWEVLPDQVAALEGIAQAMRRVIERNPAEVFLIEGHTDAVGPDIDNLSLSDRRAESVALVLTERHGVPAENLTTQGYGEEFLKVATTGASRENRRVAVRRITPLLSGTDGAG